VARNAAGERLIAASELYLAPLTTSLAADEILAEARFTLPPPARAGASRKSRDATGTSPSPVARRSSGGTVRGASPARE
jgi:CO/xanthine dehydrogenase FAD-binding subunit